jgi:hypothetical protein
MEVAAFFDTETILANPLAFAFGKEEAAVNEAAAS